MTPKEFISQVKDYADCADAAYAMLQYVEKNDEQGWLDDIKIPPLWLYADRIKLGYELPSDIDILDKNQNIITTRKAGEPTAYATIIEARFSADLTIQKPVIKKELKK